MVLFAKSATTKAYLFAQRAFSTTKSTNFSYLIKDIKIPFKKAPHPEHAKGVSMWRNLFLLGGLPAILLVNANIIMFEDHHPKRPEFRPYEYMRMRVKRFPWGDGNHSLFHNEYYNALPDGYETEEEHGGHH